MSMYYSTEMLACSATYFFFGLKLGVSEVAPTLHGLCMQIEIPRKYNYLLLPLYNESNTLVKKLLPD